MQAALVRKCFAQNVKKLPNLVTLEGTKKTDFVGVSSVVKVFGVLVLGHTIILFSDGFLKSSDRLHEAFQMQM